MFDFLSQTFDTQIQKFLCFLENVCYLKMSD